MWQFWCSFFLYKKRSWSGRRGFTSLHSWKLEAVAEYKLLWVWLCIFFSALLESGHSNTNTSSGSLNAERLNPSSLALDQISDKSKCRISWVFPWGRMRLLFQAIHSVLCGRKQKVYLIYYYKGAFTTRGRSTCGKFYFNNFTSGGSVLSLRIEAIFAVLPSAVL